MIKRLFREFFLLSRSEQRGLFIAACIFFITLVFRFIMGFLPEKATDHNDYFIQEAFDLLTLPEPLRQPGDIAVSSYQVKEKLPLKEVILPVNFNPNDISESELAKMNIPRFVASNIIKFRNAGGRFYRSEDLLRIYGLDTALYMLLKPYIILPSPSVPVKSIQKTDLNSADSAMLVRLPGIGPVYAGRILKYRSLLGGFTLMSQLNEVYGLESFPIDEIDSLVFLDLTRVNRLDLNSVGYSELLRHPYLSKNDVNAIMQYREFAGKIRNVDELYSNSAIDSLTWESIRSYLIADENDTTSNNLLH